MTTALGIALLLGPLLYALTWMWLRQGLNRELEDRLCAENRLAFSTKGSICTDSGLSSSVEGTQFTSWATEEYKQAVVNESDSLLPASSVVTSSDLVEEASQGELLFSVLIAARNEAANLPHLLQALRNQHLPIRPTAQLL
jgi:hypothetical protein